MLKVHAARLDTELDEKLVEKLARPSSASISPMAAFLGGILGTSKPHTLYLLLRLLRCPWWLSCEASLIPQPHTRTFPLFFLFFDEIGQEVLKAASGKYTPIRQHFYFDAETVLADDDKALDLKEFTPSG